MLKSQRTYIIINHIAARDVLKSRETSVALWHLRTILQYRCVSVFCLISAAIIRSMATKEDTLLDSIVEEVTNTESTIAAQNDTDVSAQDSTTKKTPAPTKKPVAKKTTTKKTTPTKKAPATDDTPQDEDVMAQLLEQSPEPPTINDVIRGTVLSVASNVVYLDLGVFGTGIVIGRETKDGMATEKIAVGDVVNATVIDLDTDDGYIELSIREASYDSAWGDLEEKAKEKEPIVTKIRDANKGGLIVEVNGIGGFLPVSQLSSDNYPRVEDGDKTKILEMLKQLIGRELTVVILDANRDDEKLIVSEKAAGSKKEREALATLNVGDEIEGEVSGVVKFGAFVKFFPPTKEGLRKEGACLEGLVHISELAWQLIDDPRDIVKTGDTVKAKVIGIDDTRISLSMKALAQDPWDVVMERYKVGDIVDGKVDKINHFGAFVYLDNDIHGLAHVSEFRDLYPGKRFEDMIGAGNTYKWKILSIEPKSHRMGLLLQTKEVLAKAQDDATQTTPDTK